ncbi:MAG: heat-inducible transcriptional repressor HrcA [Rhodospirillales bacterium]|nr:heat-inducible transcriptional repressor HrcA [Rhodospirillales bacterium]
MPKPGTTLVKPVISELSERSREVFRQIVDAYLETGEPVGSRTLSRRLSVDLSPATVRNVMADLQEAGLLYAPHTSAGRLPTEAGLRLFVDGLLEVGNLTEDERERISGQCAAAGANVEGMLQEASTALSGLSRCASLVLAPKTESPLRHIEFINLNPGRALVVLVSENGVVENRIFEIPKGLPPSALVEATNYLSARLVGRTISEGYQDIMAEIEEHRARLDELSARVVQSGLATWAGDKGAAGTLIVRGQANLLSDISGLADLEQIRSIFSALETKETVVRLLSLSERAEGVRIFIGAANELFALSGCSFIVGPYRNTRQEIIGAVGVIGPTRMNYARIIPMVDYTAKLIGRLIG